MWHIMFNVTFSCSCQIFRTKHSIETCMFTSISSLNQYAMTKISFCSIFHCCNVSLWQKSCAKIKRNFGSESALRQLEATSSGHYIVNHWRQQIFFHISWFPCSNIEQGKLKFRFVLQQRALKDHSTYFGCHCVMLNTKLVLVKYSQKIIHLLVHERKIYRVYLFHSLAKRQPQRRAKKAFIYWKFFRCVIMCLRFLAHHAIYFIRLSIKRLKVLELEFRTPNRLPFTDNRLLAFFRNDNR